MSVTIGYTLYDHRIHVVHILSLITGIHTLSLVMHVHTCTLSLITGYSLYIHLYLEFLTTGIYMLYLITGYTL